MNVLLYSLVAQLNHYLALTLNWNMFSNNKIILCISLVKQSKGNQWSPVMPIERQELGRVSVKINESSLCSHYNQLKFQYPSIQLTNYHSIPKPYPLSLSLPIYLSAEYLLALNSTPARNSIPNVEEDALDCNFLWQYSSIHGKHCEFVPFRSTDWLYALHSPSWDSFPSSYSSPA